MTDSMLNKLFNYFLGHLQLSLAAIFLSSIISITLGIFLTRNQKFKKYFMTIASLIQTIPNLALLAIMIPILAFFSDLSESYLNIKFSSIGFLPAFIALTLYSILPTLHNTIIGIEDIDKSLIQAARATGMSPHQRLYKVEFPLALPMIVAGIRTASVWCIGMATLSTLVGATSLGNFIFEGLQTRNTYSVLIGCVSSALLAIFVDTLIHQLEISYQKNKTLLRNLLLMCITFLYVLTFSHLILSKLSSGEEKIKIGSKSFTEQYILAEIISKTIKKDTSLRTKKLQSLGSSVIFNSLKNNEIDVYVDYTGTIWATIMKKTDTSKGRKYIMQSVQNYLLKEYGIFVVGALGFENTYALALKKSFTKKYKLENLSDLKPFSSTLTIAGDYEIFGRKEWKSIVSTYGYIFAQKQPMDPALMYKAVFSGDVDVITAYSTDGRISAFDLQVLKDDKNAIPPYDAIILVSSKIQKKYPHVIESLQSLVHSLDNSTMQELNKMIDIDKKSISSIYPLFLDLKK